MAQSFTFDEFKKGVSDFLHQSLTADMASLELAYASVSSIYHNIIPEPQGTLKIVSSSTWRFVVQEYEKSTSKAFLKNLSV